MANLLGVYNVSGCGKIVILGGRNKFFNPLITGNCGVDFYCISCTSKKIGINKADAQKKGVMRNFIFFSYYKKFKKVKRRDCFGQGHTGTLEGFRNLGCYNCPRRDDCLEMDGTLKYYIKTLNGELEA